jgi:hypothetical protein
MEKLATLPIDWASVDWSYVVALVLLVFFCTIVGTTLAFGRAFPSAVLSTLLFAGAFLFWTYYPHSLPLPTWVKAGKAAQASQTGDLGRPNASVNTSTAPTVNPQPR